MFFERFRLVIFCTCSLCRIDRHIYSADFCEDVSPRCPPDTQHLRKVKQVWIIENNYHLTRSFLLLEIIRRSDLSCDDKKWVDHGAEAVVQFVGLKFFVMRLRSASMCKLCVWKSVQNRSKDIQNSAKALTGISLYCRRTTWLSTQFLGRLIMA